MPPSSPIPSNPTAGSAPPAKHPATLEPGTVWLSGLDLDQPGEPFEAFASVLSQDERQRAERFVRRHDGQRFTVARGMLRRGLGQVLGLDPSAVEFTYAVHGKPMIADRTPDGRSVQFNLAHSDRFAMLAITADDPIGIDLEKVRAVKSRDGIVRKHFSPSEREAFQRLAEAERQEAFFRVWTRKEAIVKAIGTGLTLSLTSFDVSLDPSPSSALLAMRHPDHSAEPWVLLPIGAPAGFCAALALARAEPIQIRDL